MKYVVTLVCAVSLALVFIVPAGATDKPCARTTFKTKLIKNACAKGGQKAAKTAMKAFVKKNKKTNDKIENCSSCHSKLGPKYPLKSDGLAIFKAAGGK